MTTNVERGARGNLVVTSVVVEREQLDRLDTVAARERRSRSFVIRDAIDDLLVRDERRNAARSEAR